LGLSASTISFHLKKLDQAGIVEPVREQYYVMYGIRRGIVKKSLEEILTLETRDTELLEKRIMKYRQKVLKAFMRNGRLTSIPVQRKKRRIIQEEIARSFEMGKRYPEKAINLNIADFHDDFCTLRRELICEKIMKRDKGIYWLITDPREFLV